MKPADRALTADERALLGHLLAAAPIAQAVRRQARGSRVRGICDCGCGTIHLAVDRTSASPGDGLALWIVQASVLASGHDEVLLFVRDGWLSTLEVVWFDRPRPLPGVDDVGPPRVVETGLTP
jgi:hypothetical protein